MAGPKTRGKRHIPLSLVLVGGRITSNKCVVEIENNKLYVDGREVNSFSIKSDGFVIIISQHFTSKEVANNVRVYRRFNPTEEDNYAYFIENGFYNLSKDEVRHLTGASNAEVRFDVEFSVEAKRVWIKVEKQHPVKFVIEQGLDPDEIISLTVSRLS